MFKSIAKACLIGALAGIAADYLAALFASYMLHLGYFMPCLASLPEQVGGELNAVLLQLLVCVLLGAASGTALMMWHRKYLRSTKKDPLKQRGCQESESGADRPGPIATRPKARRLLVK